MERLGFRECTRIEPGHPRSALLVASDLVNGDLLVCSAIAVLAGVTMASTLPIMIGSQAEYHALPVNLRLRANLHHQW